MCEGEDLVDGVGFERGGTGGKECGVCGEGAGRCERGGAVEDGVAEGEGEGGEHLCVE